MKYYIIITGATFGLIVLAHFARLYQEGLRLARDPFFILTTIVAIGLLLWAFYLLRKLTRSN